MAEILWQPSEARRRACNITAFEQALAGACGRDFAGYADWHRYSTEQAADFWRFYLRYSGLPVQGGETAAIELLQGDQMANSRWFTGATTNYARAMLYPSAPESVDNQLAIIARHENGDRRCLTYAELREQVAACAAALRAAGVERGDRVAAMLGNVPETVILLCACAAIGALFSSCSPDFGEQAVLSRFEQITPKILFAQPAYSYQGRRYNTVAVIEKLAAATAGLAATVFVPDAAASADDKLSSPAVRWDDWLAAAAGQPLSFAEVPFEHPLYILYSSGTTGLPKAIVHRTGGVMLKHHTEHHLHSDIRAGDKIFYFTTCGWMMWNWLVSALMQAATIVLYEGSPAYPDMESLWRLAEQEQLTFFGTSARYIQSSGNAAPPHSIADLSALRTLASTGSVLSRAAFTWLYENVKSDMHVASISGGTDIVGCFVLGNPAQPVVAGEIQVPAAGVDVAAYDEQHTAVLDKPGELVARSAFPSMPLKFWHDDDNRRYQAAYFSHIPGVWRHGDRITIRSGGGIIVHGRSDTTLNPGGVRIGSADITRPLEQLETITDAAAVAKKIGEDEEIWLFVVLRPGITLDDALTEEIRQTIRRAASPRHVPRRCFAVSQLPRTRSGKTTELAITDVINGRVVANRLAMANPEALDEIAAVVQALE